MMCGLSTNVLHGSHVVIRMDRFNRMSLRPSFFPPVLAYLSFRLSRRCLTLAVIGSVQRVLPDESNGAQFSKYGHRQKHVE